MLKNELQELEKLIPLAGFGALRHFGVELNDSFEGIRSAWRNAAFSDLSEQGLLRYFYYHLEGIRQLSDTLFNINSKSFDEWQDGLLSLVDHMLIYYKGYFNQEAPAPIAYHRKLIFLLSGSLGFIREGLLNPAIDQTLKICLTDWMEEIATSGYRARYSFRSLFYFEHLIRKLEKLDMTLADAGQVLITVLAQSNFNHLTFLECRQKAAIAEAGSSFSSYQVPWPITATWR